MLERATWAAIDLEAIAHNMEEIKTKITKETQICAVVKADAYGHGVNAVAKTVLQAGADRLAVAIVQEAVELRQGGFEVPILVLGCTPDWQATTVVENNVTQTICTLASAQALSAAALVAGKIVKVHIKIDTGMSRIGVQPEDAGEFAALIAQLPGIFTFCSFR